MSNNLVIVESPAKAKTLKQYLGQDFEIVASYGHIRDLVPKSGAVQPENDFCMHYQLIEKNAKHANAILKAIKQHTHLYLATDPDREGEAIAWHIHEFLKEKKALKNKTIYRATFHEITETAVKQAIFSPKQLAMNLIDAQQARRALDYLFGFTLSPLLWKKVRPGLSAGRVQSPALRLIVERELEIERFTSQEYWTIAAHLSYQASQFSAQLTKYQGTKLTQFSISAESEANKMQADLAKAAHGSLSVRSVDTKARRRNPAAPFITSTLQQEAAHKLGFTAQRTMRIAQQLYEGIDIGSAHVGLITYIRTDSTVLSSSAILGIRKLIEKLYGKKALPKQPRVFSKKIKNAQEAHEAIRPTDVSRLPEALKQSLNIEQFRLYELIWKRTIASQMIQAELEMRTIELEDGKLDYYRTTCTTIKHPGFMQVYLETEEIEHTPSGHTTSAANDGKAAPLLPELKVGDTVELLKIIPTQHFTEPPPRYSEATLIKTLESHSIGRPSTYVPIITTLQQREYVTLTQKRFHLTDVGRIVYQFLMNYFTHYIDYKFTAHLEESLDAIARGEQARVPILADFWTPFKEKVEHTQATVKRAEVTQEMLDENCPKCDKPLTKRLGKRGCFIGCSGYPDCDYTHNIGEDKADADEPKVVSDRKCPDCQQDLHIKRGRYGKFIGCSQYPKCKHIEPLEKPPTTGVTCPECHAHPLLQRKSRYGKVFYSCQDYPKCKYATWNAPIKKPCPRCAWPILTVKTTKRKGTENLCPRKTCNYTEKA